MMSTDLSPPLWRLLQGAADVLASIRAGRSGTAALNAVPTEMRPGVQSLSYRVLRELGRAEVLRQQLATRKPAPAVDALLCTALALVWDEAAAPYDSFTLVNQAVEAAKRHPALHAQAGFINGCLRRFLREREAMVTHSEQQAVAVWNHPAWWIKQVQREYPDHWRAILQANNTQAPMTLRINPRLTDVKGYLDRLRTQGLVARVAGPYGLILDKPVSVHELPGFDQGWVSVQDAAAQMAAPLLLQGWVTTPTMRILDACAAPGGKTAHLLELSPAEVTALDIDPQRCTRIEQTLQRLDLQAKVLVADAAQPNQWWDGVLFDAILLDAPCTASGIVRRHPDVRWLRRESDVAQLAAQQRRLLETLWPMLKPGGRMLFCTCSVFKAEGETQIQTFLARNTQARLLPSPGHLMPTFATRNDPVPDNETIDHDGFYYALLEKRAT
jgi:16S rRNA (cytosine967-C5)-methyltransferase